MKEEVEKPKGQIKEFDSDVPYEWKPIYVLLCDVMYDNYWFAKCGIVSTC